MMDASPGGDGGAWAEQGPELSPHVEGQIVCFGLDAGRRYVRKRRAYGLNREGSWPTLISWTRNHGRLEPRR